MSFQIGDIVDHAETGADLVQAIDIYGPGPFVVVDTSTDELGAVNVIVRRLNPGELFPDGRSTATWYHGTVKLNAFMTSAKRILDK